MCKRYYIEVTGLDNERGEEQLQKAGVNKKNILVVDEANPIGQAIKDVLGVGMQDITNHTSGRSVVAARTIYVHFALLSGDSIGKIAHDIERTRYRVNYYEADYDRKMYGDREFRLSSDRVQKKLEDNGWKPANSDRNLSRVLRKVNRNKRLKKAKRIIAAKERAKLKKYKGQLEIQFKF